MKNEYLDDLSFVKLKVCVENSTKTQNEDSKPFFNIFQQVTRHLNPTLEPSFFDFQSHDSNLIQISILGF